MAPLALGIGVGVSFGRSGSRPIARYGVTASGYAPDAGTTVPITAQLLHADGTNDATADVTVNWIKYGPGGSLSASSSVTNGSGVATTNLTVSAVAGTVHAVRATDSSGRTGVTAALVVQEAPPFTHFDPAHFPSSHFPAVHFP
jgi:hypothetical protein